MSPSTSSPSVFDQLANKATKWGVTGLAAAVVLWRHDPAAMWAVTGAIVNSANAKFLKQCINQQRPATAVLKTDAGMPSTHAQSLGYLSTYAAIGIAGWNGLNLVSLGLCAIVLGCAVYLAYLRVCTGLHSGAQVVIGAAIGSSSAVVWSWIWKAVVARYMVEMPWISMAVWIAFLVAASSFVAFVVKNWRIGDS
ncbi:hypothetical protein SELMODRAFT_73772 [Selaginella moellendorffii]|uniref:Phosphatidic acid phosphatase type 2/haloperoxidase domain-containing protein n=2 Tax=Selaginella moellendorffii TaxID=88036 RepID=D8QPS3_SELML|nr:hypothetical protein SELMODRAFT_73772 [Selaginella moellendorffii]